jgi:CubicO group peptidase (beta-lactamase class C family)/GNAT superfamily N-acetyltransferase
MLIPFTPSHHTDALRIWNAAVPADYPLDERLLAYNMIPSSGETIAGRLAIRNGESVGFVLACAANIGWISALAVQPSAQGQGLGSELIQWAEDWLKEKGITRIRIGGNLRPFAPGLPYAMRENLPFFTKHGYISPAGQPYEYDIARDLEHYQALYAKPAHAELAPMQAGEEPLLLEFLAREYPGRWEFEAREFIQNGGRATDFLLLRVQGAVHGFCRITLEDSERPIERFYPQRLPRPWGQFGPLGLSKVVRGQGLGGYLIDVAAVHLQSLGVRGCVIDWTALVDLYGKFKFTVYNRYVSLYKEIQNEEGRSQNEEPKILHSPFRIPHSILAQAIGTITPAAQLAIRHKGELIYETALGFLDTETRQRPTHTDSLFDLASVTKLYVTTAFMTLVEAGKVTLDTPVREVLPEFDGLRPIQPYENPLDWGKLVSLPPLPHPQPLSQQERRERVDAGKVTFRNLLIHNSGLPAWRPFKDQADVESVYRMALGTFFSYPLDERIVYSDVGLILLGLAISRLTGSPLDEAIYQRVTRPLGLESTHYLPTSQSHETANIAPTEFCHWRGRRMLGEVHDENAWRLGGISGHAGMFSNAREVAAFGQSFLNASIFRRETIAEMTRLQAEFDAVRRGIGFALWSADPEASSHPFSPLTFGHTGFTGTCLWIDPQRELVVALLTNDVYGGREGRGIASLRVQVHQAIVESVDKL